ncbi:MAG: chloride channel protein [Actinobacteria bacterium]|nr:chloride channel protein [Actinomycetota bacterium]
MLQLLGIRDRRYAALVVGTGFAGGLVGAAYLGLLRVVDRLLGPDAWAALPHLVVLAAVGLAVAGITRLLGNPPNVELLVANIHVLGGSKDVRSLRSLLPISLVCVGSGGALGPEAPLVQTTGSLGTAIAQRAKLPRSQVRVITISGMAAGFTVLFGAPIGAALFALEILHRRGLQYYEALVPSLVGAVCGQAVYVLVTGAGLQPVFRLPAAGDLRALDLAWAGAAGVIGAAVAWTFTYLSRALQRAARVLPDTVRPVVGGATLGLLALWTPYALTNGERQVDQIVAAKVTVAALLVAVVGKLLGTTVTMAAGWRGGFIIPLFFIGATLGVLVHRLAPGADQAALIAGLMVACNVGVTKTPLGSTLVVSEMAGLALLPTTLIAALVSLVLTSPVALIHTQRQREEDDADEPPLLDRTTGEAA